MSRHGAHADTNSTIYMIETVYHGLLGEPDYSKMKAYVSLAGFKTALTAVRESVALSVQNGSIYGPFTFRTWRIVNPSWEEFTP